ncbi:hypothetical protein K435DRAFT_753469 [Dendrothele bispora CBS 962.96]|uniref:LYC1 C-terminal domain-containing protein n=1 Tax=Dendrothele bispora (strain CBS 962.96) TaxID=1314807 RepID=A0A4S8M6W8_DENBC|nr:hypothetical protein K435DRAFT_753469 [Dendrothele bispora CBS 962.96]
MSNSDVDLASLSLFLATPEQATESRRRTHKVWGNGMTEEEYISRDEECAQSLCGCDGKFKTWVLAPRDNPQTLDFKCSCETFQRTGVVHRLNTSTEVSSYGIASVFTPPQHRRKGYACHMMHLLHWILAPKSYLDPATFPEQWGAPPPSCSLYGGDAQFSALYSDVGDFYLSCGPKPNEDGWVIRGANSVVWDVDQIPEPSASETLPAGDWKWLIESDLHDLMLRDSLLLQSENNSTAPVSFTFLPFAGVEAFQRERQKIFWEKEIPPIEKWGIIHGSVNNVCPTTCFATWTFELKPSMPRTLVITRLRVDEGNEAQVRDLFRFVFQVAKTHKVMKIEVWDVPSSIKDTLTRMGGQAVKRDEHLPAFKWYGPEKHETIVWLHNEKFGWC